MSCHHIIILTFTEILFHEKDFFNKTNLYKSKYLILINFGADVLWNSVGFSLHKNSIYYILSLILQICAVRMIEKLVSYGKPFSIVNYDEIFMNNVLFHCTEKEGFF